MGLLLAAGSSAVQDLEAGSIATGAPTVGSPTIGQPQDLVAVSIATGAPTVGAPTIGTGTGAPSQDFRNVLDGPGERYWLDKKEREKERKRKRDAERIEALERELRELDAEKEAPRKPAIALVETPEPAPKKKRGAKKRAVIETPELILARAEALAAAEAQARLFDEEAAIILLLAA